MTLLDLRRDARQTHLDGMQTILDAAAADDGRELTDEENAQLTEHRSAIEHLDTQIAAIEADLELLTRQRSDREFSAPAEQPRPRLNRVDVGREPGPYDEPQTGYGRFLLDTAISDGVYAGVDRTRPENDLEEVRQRLQRHQAMLADHPRLEVRAVSTSSLAGIVNPQFDPAMISRGVHDAGVTLQLMTRYPVWPEGDSITMPRVTKTAAASIHKEGGTYQDNTPTTAGVKAALFEVAAQAVISLRAIERGNLATDLLRDELARAWIETFNALVLAGNNNASSSEQPPGLLALQSTNSDQYVEKDDASPTPAKALDYLAAAKAAVWKADRRRVTAHIISDNLMGLYEGIKDTTGQYVLPSYPAWARNAGGAGEGIPAMEGPMSETEWRRVPIYVDPAISNSWRDDGTGAGQGGDQTRIISMVRDEMPVFYDGPMTTSFEQTRAATGEVLLVTRGYGAFNPLWRPGAWRVVRGTGLKLGTVGVEVGDGDTVDIETTGGDGNVDTTGGDGNVDTTGGEPEPPRKK